MKKIIFALVSEMAGGKETVKKYLEKNYQANSCRFSSIIRDILDKLYLKQSRNNIQKLSTALRQNFGQDIFSLSISKQVEALDSPMIVLDGVRRQADLKYLKKLDNFYLISVQSEPNTRYQRLIKRAENPGDNQKTYEDFLADHQKESDQAISLVMKEADYTVDNNGSLDDLYKQIDKIIKDRQNN